MAGELVIISTLFCMTLYLILHHGAPELAALLTHLVTAVQEALTLPGRASAHPQARQSV